MVILDDGEIHLFPISNFRRSNTMEHALDHIPNSYPEPPPNQEGKLIVDYIYHKEVVGGVVYYLVAWEGRDAGDSRWLKAQDLLNASSRIAEYEKWVHDKVRDERRERMIHMATKVIKRCRREKCFTWVSPDLDGSGYSSCSWICVLQLRLFKIAEEM